MVKVTKEDLEDDEGLLKYLSDTSDDDEESRRKQFLEVETEVVFNPKFGNVLILAELPIVSESKVAKLREVLTDRIAKELLSKQVIGVDCDGGVGATTATGSSAVQAEGGSATGGLGAPEAPFTLDLPMEGDKTVGVCFVIFKDEFDARKAAQHLSSVGLDSKHRFKVCRLDDFDNVTSADLSYEPVTSVGFDRTKLRDWLKDALGREQYLYRCGPRVEVICHDPLEREPISVFPKHERMGQFVAWSPQGSYMVAFHKRGIALSGDTTFTRKVRFNHANVKYVHFSPNEEYLITWDGSDARSHNDKAVMVWRVLTGECLRYFPTPEYSASGIPTEKEGAWPFFLFSPDSKYVAKRQHKSLVIYELPSMLVLEEPAPPPAPTAGTVARTRRTGLSYPLEMFEWSPTANVISVWIPEDGDTPGRLLLVEIPSRHELASKNVFGVKHASIHWQQSRGDFVALVTIIARKKGKKSKTETTQIEIFKVKQKSIPVDTISIEGARVKGLYWEGGPVASRFAIVKACELSSNHSIRFYQVPSTGDKLDTELVDTLSVPYSINCLEWSPAGQYFVAAVRGGEGSLVFGYLGENNKAEIVARDTYSDLTDVLWDPSGRFVCAAVLIPQTAQAFKYSASAGFRIYSFLGRLQYRLQDEALSQFFWRPRPPSLLSQEKIDDVHRKLKEYSKKYDTQDEARRNAKKKAFTEEHGEIMRAFYSKVTGSKEKLQSHPSYKEWLDGWQALDEKLRWHTAVQTAETVIDVQREVIEEKS